MSPPRLVGASVAVDSTRTTSALALGNGDSYTHLGGSGKGGEGGEGGHSHSHSHKRVLDSAAHVTDVEDLFRAAPGNEW